MKRGPQFPLVNEQHFNATAAEGVGGRPLDSDERVLMHRSQHGEYEIEHHFEDYGDGRGYGIVKVKHASKRPGYAWNTNRGAAPAGTVATLKYDLDSLPRATTMRPQPLTHTEYIDVDHEHQGKGLTHVMQGVLQRAHPGAPNIASNELTYEGSHWRSHMAKSLRDPGMGQRIGWGGEDGDERVVLRPEIGVPINRLHQDDFIATSDNFVAKGKR